MRDGKTKMVKQWQLPMTGAYGFTDYQAHGQTIQYVVIDLAPQQVD